MLGAFFSWFTFAMAPWPLPQEYHYGSMTLWLDRNVQYVHECVEASAPGFGKTWNEEQALGFVGIGLFSLQGC
jgi:hypothetical protein